MEFFWRKRKRLKLEAEKKAKEEKRQEEQEELGYKILAFLTSEAAKNKVHGNCPNEDSRGTIIFECTAKNGKSFSMLAGIPNKDVILSSMRTKRGYAIFQIDINLSSPGKELHVHTAPYGPDNYWSIEDLEVFKDTMSREFINYRLYK